MFVIVNGQTYPLPELRTLAALLSQLSPAAPFVVACNAEVVPRGSYAQLEIQPGNRIDIVHLAAGADMDQLILYGHKFTSRLLLGTARYDSPASLGQAIAAADPAMLTVSLRRQVSGSSNSGQAFWKLLREIGRTILPNTAGCFTARETVKTACMARELFKTGFFAGVFLTVDVRF